MPRKKYSINIGDRFGRLVVLEDLGTRGKRCIRYFLCQCDCGEQKEIVGTCLTQCHTRSCGCYRREVTGARGRDLRNRTTHGMHKTRIYKIWEDMKGRCNNPKKKAYHNYGGRGIRVCDEWQRFEPFWEWAQANGYNDTLSIDRIDVNGNYCPENCRWADIKTQANNKRTNKRYAIRGKNLTVSEWCELTGINRSAMASWQRHHGEAYVIQRIEQVLKEQEESPA